MPVIVIVVAGAASHLCRLPVNERDDCVIGDATALDAMVVDNVAESVIAHRTASKRSIPNLPVAEG